MKTCTKCLVPKPFEEFGIKKSASDGHRPYCNLCRKAQTAKYYIAQRELMLERSRKWKDANRAACNEYSRTYIDENKEEVSKRRAIYRKSNKTRIAAYMAEYRQQNPEIVTNATRTWRKSNPHKVAATRALRRAQKLQATPAWAEDFLIEEAYDLAQRRTAVFGFEWHVDHIVPLRGKTVCGLHVHNNLQVIPGAENCRKNNRYWPDMPGDNHKDRNGPERSSTDDLDHTWQPAGRNSGVQHGVAGIAGGNNHG